MSPAEAGIRFGISSTTRYLIRGPEGLARRLITSEVVDVEFNACDLHFLPAIVRKAFAAHKRRVDLAQADPGLVAQRVPQKFVGKLV